MSSKVGWARAQGVLTATTRMKILAQRRAEDEAAAREDMPRTPPNGEAVDGHSAIRTGYGSPTHGMRETSALLGDTASVTGAAKRNPFISDISAMKDLICSQWINLLLICVPIGLVAGVKEWAPAYTFILNFMALVPLALVLGDVTEDLSLRLGPVAGGLVNASFGNVTEVVLSIAALHKGLLTVVANSLIGSILSNLLLVMGCSFIVGGMNYRTQSWNATSNRSYSSLLFLASIGIVIPTAASHMVPSTGQSKDWVLDVSRGGAIVLLLSYVCYLVFQLHTHHDLFDEDPKPAGGAAGAMESGQLVRSDSVGHASSEEEEEEEEPVLTSLGAVTALAVISILVAVHSEFLTGALEQTSKDTNIPLGFLSIIVLPIAGNACEHITAVVVAAKNKMDLSMGIAIGSSLQIALFAIPLLVLVGWGIGQPMSLDYDLFSVTALILSVMQAAQVTADAQSHWLMGVQLVALYVLIGMVYWFRADGSP